ncbi:hypothetical protein BRCON_0573 [Candidatus Sumerlaea chitinivorans]|uniref:Uncharacterized protein n=1 Tax=Sumerlaea chitinivorans TaxID=2250252 RepID=A0A2Z4Y2M9_SUMC1|nr:hypothetical protein BRCON_0573 [Candidatus Sumerlaea chitinivorans]
MQRAERFLRLAGSTVPIHGERYFDTGASGLEILTGFHEARKSRVLCQKTQLLDPCGL